MELSSKSKTIKKKPKKKKIRVPESALLPIIKPDVPNGDCNWMKLQQIIGPGKRESSSKDSSGPGKRESSSKDSRRKMLKITGINLNSKDYKPPFSQKTSFHKKILSQTSQDNGIQEKIRCDKKHNTQDKFNNTNDSSINCDLSENSKVSSNEAQDESFSFNFNSSLDTTSSIKFGHEIKKNGVLQGNDERKLTKAVAMDCEMVGTGPKGEESIIARVSIVNSHGDCLYDEFVKPKEKVTDFRTEISGVRPSDLKNGKDLFDVQKDVLNIIEGRILVGHAIKHDLDVLFISHPGHLIRDTAFYKPFRELCGGKTPSLKKLTSKILGCEIQSGEHSSVEDAQATMLLYLRQRREWESLIKSHRKRKPKMIENQMKN